MAGASLAPGQLLSNLSGMFSFGSTCVGLSIGSSSIKLAELRKMGKGWKLVHFGIYQLPDEAIVNREIVNHVAVVESIKTLVGQISLKNRAVCTSISGSSLIIKRMALDVPNLRDLQDQVFWEAEQYLPFDASEVVMDYHLLSRGKSNHTDVILVAVKSSVLDSYISCVEDSGLRPKIVDVDFFALQNAFEINYPSSSSGAVAIVDLGASSTKFLVVQGGVPIFTKDSAVGGRNLTFEIQRHLNLSYLDAETLKTSGQNGSMPQEVMDLVQVMNENMAVEIKKAIDFYNASSIGGPIEYLLLAGGCARTPGLSKVVEEVGGLPTQIINPFNAISCDPKIFTQDYLAAIGPVAAVPIGLALRAAYK
ncbi:MAG: type IV pilus assembly protein PilM [Oligoflexia bacterium]|nr:type IV pilus assembly protein PilM [Oligoflexia bacterium]